MRLRILVLVAWMVGTGYVTQYCYRAMNIASDYWYGVGIAGCLFWLLVVTPIAAKVVFQGFNKKAKRKDSNDKDQGSTGGSAYAHTGV